MLLNNHSNKSKKLIVYCSVPIFDTWPKKLELEKFKNYGFDVELWSTEEIFHKIENIKAASEGSDGYLYTDMDVIKIRNFVDLENKVKELDSKAIICIMSLGSFNNNHFDNPDLDIFNKYNIKYILFHLYPHFVVQNLWFKLKFSFRLFQKRLYNYKKKPSLIFGTGNQGRKQVFKTYKKKFIYKSLPSFNILWFKEEPIINKKYIVYVEESLNLSTDSKLFGKAGPVKDLEGCYKRINNVFEKIEKWTNFKVLIAASGKYKYKINPFKNRQIIYKKTPNLIQHSEIVLGHKSTGLDQALVDFKPLLMFKDIGFSDYQNKLINNIALSYKLNSIWTHQLTKANFEKNNYVNLINNKETINEYFKEKNISGTFIENITSAFHQL